MTTLRIVRVKILKSSLGIVRISIIFIVDNISTDSIKEATLSAPWNNRKTWTRYSWLMKFFGFFGVKFRILPSKIIGI
jgi:hypothetical protein